MKIKQAVAVAFLVSLGFEKASEWENTKLADRLRQVPDRVDETKVGDEFKDVYAALKALGADDTITVESGAEKKAAPAKAPKAEKSEPKAKAEKKAAPAKAAKPEKKSEEPKLKAKAEKAPKAEKPAKSTVETDDYGFRKTSNRSKVLAAVSSKGTDLEAIVTESGVSKKAVVSLLGWATRNGLVQKQKVITFSLMPKK